MANAKIPRLTFDTQRINDDVPIRAVIAAYAGITPPERGNIPCPSVSHTDKNPSAHIYGNRCKCFACGESFTPITLAKERYPDLSFSEVCEQLLKDFDMDIYAYSNLQDVEAVTQAKSETKFCDHFPLTEKELKFIGLQNPRPHRLTFAVGAVSYFAYFDGVLPDDKSLLYDENGKERLIEATEYEAVEMGIVSEEYIESEKRRKSPTMQELWRENDEQKEHIEQMILGYAREKVEECNARYEDAVETFRETASKHSKDEWLKIKKMHDSREKIIQNGGKVPVRGAAKEKLDDYFMLMLMDDMFYTPSYRDKQFADNILNKVLSLREQREQYKASSRVDKSKATERTREVERD